MDFILWNDITDLTKFGSSGFEPLVDIGCFFLYYFSSYIILVADFFIFFYLPMFQIRFQNQRTHVTKLFKIILQF